MCVENAVFSMSPFAIGTCQYPDVTSKDEKILEPASLSKVSSMRGIVYASALAIVLSLR
jgi:hypothetical protein